MTLRSAVMAKKKADKAEERGINGGADVEDSQ